MQVFFFLHTTPTAVKCARVDKTTDCGNDNILTSGGPGGTFGTHTTNILIPQSMLLQVPGQASGVC